MIDISKLMDSGEQESLCISLPNAVKQRTTSIGRCNGPFFLTDNISDFQTGTSVLPKMSTVNGLSSRDLNVLRNVTSQAWWPKILNYDVGKLPESVQKSVDPRFSVAESQPMASHCSTSPAIFVLSEPEQVKRRAEIREYFYNELTVTNVFFILSNHKQENQALETQLEMESSKASQILVKVRFFSFSNTFSKPCEKSLW